MALKGCNNTNNNNHKKSTWEDFYMGRFLTFKFLYLTQILPVNRHIVLMP